MRRYEAIEDRLGRLMSYAGLVSAGATKGDGWVDAHGQFDAAAAASPVYKLLGGQGLGTDAFPPITTEVGNGPLAFRQHTEGHTPAPNWPSFLTFAQRELYGPDFTLNLRAQGPFATHPSKAATGTAHAPATGL